MSETQLREAKLTTLFPGERGLVIGFIGRVTPDKGIETLSKALGLLAAEGCLGSCLIIGGDDGPRSRDLRELLDNTGWRTVHTGQLEDVQEAAQLMDILCLPSLREGFPNVVLEAAVLGIGCIGSDATGVRDAIIDGKTGLLFRKGDAADLADKIKTLFTNRELLSMFGEAACSNAVKNYDRRSIWNMHENFYLELIARGRRVR